MKYRLYFSKGYILARIPKLPTTSCGFATVAEIGTEFARLDGTKLGNYNLIL